MWSPIWANGKYLAPLPSSRLIACLLLVVGYRSPLVRAAVVRLGRQPVPTRQSGCLRLRLALLRRHLGLAPVHEPDGSRRALPPHLLLDARPAEREPVRRTEVRRLRIEVGRDVRGLGLAA